MQVGDQCGHLLLGEAAAEAGHHSLPCQDILSHGRIGGRRAAGQGDMVEDAMQVGRNLLESQVVLLVAVGAAYLVEVLARRLLRSQRRRSVAARQTGRHCNAKKEFTANNAQTLLPQI